MGSPTIPVAAAPREIVEDFSRYHTFWQRFFAAFIDGCVFIPIGILNLYLVRPSRPAHLIILGAILFDLCPAIYSILMHARYGQTLGKMLVGVKVKDVSEKRLPTLMQAFLRDSGDLIFNLAAVVYVAYLLETHRYVGSLDFGNDLVGLILGRASIVWFVLEMITMLFSKKRRAFHDLIAGTVVTQD